MAQHAVERVCQLLELVVGVDLGPQLRVPATDLLADVPQMFQRFDHDVANDHVQNHHRHENGQNADRCQYGAVPRDCVSNLPTWNSHFDDADWVCCWIREQHGVGLTGGIQDFELSMTSDATVLPIDGLVVVDFLGCGQTTAVDLHRGDIRSGVGALKLDRPRATVRAANDDIIQAYRARVLKGRFDVGIRRIERNGDAFLTVVCERERAPGRSIRQNDDLLLVLRRRTTTAIPCRHDCLRKRFKSENSLDVYGI